jgi:hypothetical protein
MAWADQCGESFRRDVPSEDFPGSIVEFSGHFVEVGTREAHAAGVALRFPAAPAFYLAR